MTKVLLLLAVAALVFCSSRTASASKAYPEEIRKELGLPSKPACTLCHQTEDGRDNTVTKPFGRTMIDLDARGNSDLGSLRAALRAAREGRVDSDGDGMSDIDEILDGERDPNRAEIVLSDGGGLVLGEEPEELPVLLTGCALRAPADPAHGFCHAFVVLVLIGVTTRARRGIAARCGSAESPGTPPVSRDQGKKE